MRDGLPTTSRTLEGPGAAARAAGLRRRFAAVSPKASRGRGGGLARAGRAALVLYWAGCLAVILYGVDRMYPGLRAQALGAAPLAEAPPLGVTAAVAVERVAVERPFANCAAAHAAGVFNIPVGSPGYVERQDGDGDGLACEPAPAGRGGVSFEF